MALLVLFGTVANAAAPVAVAPAAFDHLRGMNAAAAGVDRQGNFWFWDAADSSVSSVTPRGERITVTIDDDVRALDVDRLRGIVTLGPDGTSLRWRDLGGRTTAQWQLPFAASSVCWMEGDEIAVAPETNAARAEVWSKSRKTRVRTLGAVPAITAPRAGAVLVRATLLRYDATRKQLLALDAFTGELTVFDAAGAIIRRASISHPDREMNLAWLKELDTTSKRKREQQMPSVWMYARMSVSGDGTIWLAETRTDDAVMIARILPDGGVRRDRVTAPDCASTRFELWGERMVFFRSTKSSRRCVALKEVVQ